MTVRETIAAVVGPSLAAAPEGIPCSSCGRSSLVGFYEQADLPAQSNLLVEDRSTAAGYGGASVLLALCSDCGLIQNTRFDPALIDYSLPTEESQTFSPVFADFASSLADELVAQHELVGGSVLEVGSGKGDFLGLLAARGLAKAVGIDPGYMPDRGPHTKSIEFRREFYGPSHVSETADLVIARHLLEHLPNVAEFLGWLAQSVAATPGSALFLEVPDSTRILKEGAFWDVYHEHCTYFTVDTLATALVASGFVPEKVELVFGNQYLHATARPAAGQVMPTLPASYVESLTMDVVGFVTSVEKRLRYWRSRLRTLEESRVAVWGASSKAVAFLSALDCSEVMVVDINPHKQGMWLPGLALEVLEPTRLIENTPDVVIPMNPIYADEIRADLEMMGIAAALEPV